MTLRDELTGAVYGAVCDAAKRAEDAWTDSVEFQKTAILTDKHIELFPDMASIQLTFETHRQTIPVHTKDRYGVVRKRITGAAKAKKKPDVTGTLMQESADALEKGFVDSLNMRLL